MAAIRLALMAAIRHEASGIALSWSLIAQETVKDTSLHRLLSMIRDGRWSNCTGDPSAAQFQRVFDSRYVEDGSSCTGIVLSSPLRSAVVCWLTSTLLIKALR